MIANTIIKQLADGTSVSVKVNGELVRAVYRGWSDRYDMPLVEVSGRRMPRKIFEVHEAEPLIPAESRAAEPLRRVEVAEPEAAESQSEAPALFAPDINERFSYLEELVTTVSTSLPTSLVIVGSGGLGKTYTVFETLKKLSLEERHDFVVCRGTSTPKAMYRFLYENRDKIVVFDDCDSVLENQTAVMILKAALDSVPVRQVSWLSERDGEGSLPNNFFFEGKVIFISNKELAKIPQPLLSRALFVDVTMTPAEKITRIRRVMTNVMPEVSMDDKHEVVNLLDELKDQCQDLNFRTFSKILQLKLSTRSWKNIARYTVMHN